MSMINPQLYLNFLEQFSYAGLFLFVVFSGYLIPIPEEILLLLLGYIAGVGLISIYLALAAGILGVLIGDNILFWLSHFQGSKIVHRLKKKIRKHELMKYKHLMKQHIGKTIFILRFIVGLRFFSPFLAGSLRVKWKVFQIYNLMAVSIYVPILVFLGYHFHNKILLVISSVEIVRHSIFFIFLAVVGYLITVFVRKKFLIKNSVK